MAELPADLKYAQSHEWVEKIAEDTVRIGITYFAQESLGDITYIELPSAGTQMNKGDTFGVVESVKAASDLYMPVTGEIIEANPELDDAPEAVNAAPYTDGWMLKVKLADPAQIDTLMSAEDYQNCIEQ